MRTKVKFFDVHVMQRRYSLPKDGVLLQDVSLPCDKPGDSQRIYLKKGTHIQCVSTDDAYAAGLGGVEADKITGIWVNTPEE